MQTEPRKRGRPAKAPPPPTDPHVEKALRYCREVVAGEIPACRFVRAACARQLRDLERADSDTFHYVFDQNRAGRVCRFIEQLPHVKGAKGGELIQLEDWQCFILTTVFGWLKRDTRKRRFRRVYIEVPRGNAKSTLSSGVGLYCTGADEEPGADVYSAATTRDQAKIVWGDAHAMVRKRAPLRAKLGIETSAHSIFQPSSHSKFVALSRDADNLDGLNIHCAVVDELHAHKTREVYDVVETGTGKRAQSLLWVITTAGSDTSGICYEVRGYVAKMLDGNFADESQFGIIYTVDDGDDWTDPLVWRKANPNWGVSVQPDVFAQLAQKAMQVASAQANFLTKHLDVWVNADQSWMNMLAWDKCADPSLREESFSGVPCYVGVDLASTTDIACKARLYVRDLPHRKKKGETERHYYLRLDSYLPEDSVTDGRNAQYGGWAREGWLKTTHGCVLDFETVLADLAADKERFAIREVAFDDWQAEFIIQKAQEAGLTALKYPNNVRHFSPPMKELEALVLDGRFHHDGNPLMRWMVSNVVCHTDAKDNIYPRKERPENKIDGVVATIMALGRAMTSGGEAPSVYEERGIRFL